MDREKALELLCGGEDGVKEWNRDDYCLPDYFSTDLSGADLSGADLVGVRLFCANLSGANLSGANLITAILNGADLRDVDLREADLSGADLRGADLRGAVLSHAVLNGADLSEADLRDVEFIGADLTEAHFRGSNIRRACLIGAILSGANLSGADLVAADLSEAHLSNTNLVGADLTRTKMLFTALSNLDLSSVRSLDCVEHNGPSSLGIDTILKSGGDIPRAFLEGCGVPDNWIKSLPSLLGKPIDFYSCFISYSHQDEEFSKRLHSRMREDKLRVWYAPEDMKAGRKIHEQIDTAIRLHDKLLVVLSEHSMQSEWVANEIREAFKREKQEGRRVLFPISLVPFKEIEDWKLIDSRTGTDLAEEIRLYFIPDFTNWKDHDAFEATYQRLMKDFKPAPDDK